MSEYARGRVVSSRQCVIHKGAEFHVLKSFNHSFLLTHLTKLDRCIHNSSATSV